MVSLFHLFSGLAVGVAQLNLENFLPLGLVFASKILRFYVVLMFNAGDFSYPGGSSGWTDSSIGSQGWKLFKNSTSKGKTLLFFETEVPVILSLLLLLFPVKKNPHKLRCFKCHFGFVTPSLLTLLLHIRQKASSKRRWIIVKYFYEAKIPKILVRGGLSVHSRNSGRYS